MTAPTLKLHHLDDGIARFINHALAQQGQTFIVPATFTREQAERFRRQVYNRLHAMRRTNDQELVDKQALFRATYELRRIPSAAVPGMFQIKVYAGNSLEKAKIITEIIMRRKRNGAQ